MSRRPSGEGSSSQSNSQIPEINWIPPTENPWGVPVLDVRPVTQGFVSTSKDPTCAQNAISFSNDDGQSFAGLIPPEGHEIECSIRFLTTPRLVDGVLFQPEEMEHKWALFYYHNTIICVRSWLRQVTLTAHTRQDDAGIEICSIRGTFTDDGEEPAHTVRLMDYLLRGYALDQVHPVPITSSLAQQPPDAALWCFSLFGNRAWFATPHEVVRDLPDKPLRTISLLHIAVARGDRRSVEEQLRSGVPIDIIGRDGLTPLHWSLACKEHDMTAYLLDHGCPVDARSSEGATTLMNAVQDGDLGKTRFLADKGADVNAADHRGFTSLHRAAELGHKELVIFLLERDAAFEPEAEGHTPHSLAEKRGHREIVKILDR